MGKEARLRMTWAVGSLLLVLWLTACTEAAPSQTDTDPPAATPAQSPVASIATADVPLGMWKAQDDSHVYLTLEEGGTSRGYDGCNTVGGTWMAEQDGVTITLGNVTEVLCPHDDTWLLEARAVTRDGDELIVLDESGTTIGRLLGEE